jgi:NADH:ubiquinone oxidoreductase subunit 4 (subunit M)
MSVRDGVVIAPLVAAVIAFGLYPQVALEDQERSASRAVQTAQQAHGGDAAASAAERAQAQEEPTP